MWEGGISVAWTRVGSTGWRDQVRFRIYVTVNGLDVGHGVRDDPGLFTLTAE